MRVPLEWLKDFVNIRISAKDLAAKLTMAGLETAVTDVLEVDVLPNRKDCLSVIGIAREVAAITKSGILNPKSEIRKSKKENRNRFVKIEVRDKKLCPRYMARVVENVKIGPSPDWIKRRLSAAGIRPVNNIVDITNYLLIERGQPLHAFDFELLSGQKIVVRKAQNGETIKLLDGSQRTLDSDILCIADTQKPIAVAGIMGGADTEIKDSTKVILLESAFFNQEIINKSSKKLKLRTESSVRFERGVDWTFVEETLDAAAEMIAKIAGGNIASQKFDVKNSDPKQKKISLRVERVKKVLSEDISVTKIVYILESLGFKIIYKTTKKLICEIPLFRAGDIEREIDLIEEIARIYGYDRIKPTLPKTEVWLKTDDFVDEKISIIRDILVGYGLWEIKTFSLINPASLTDLGLGEKTADIKNPFTKENSVLCPSLIPEVLKVLSHNINRQIENIAVFELDNIFIPSKNIAEQKFALAGAIIGDIVFGAKGESSKIDFYYLKNIIEAVFFKLKTDYRIIAANNNLFQPGKCAAVAISDEPIGYFGPISPDLVRKFDLKSDAYVFEFVLDQVLQKEIVPSKYKSIPKLPFVIRYISILVPPGVTSEMILFKIRNSGGGILEDVILFDKYMSPVGFSLAYSIIYRDNLTTLTDEKVNETHAKISNALVSDLGVKIR